MSHFMAVPVKDLCVALSFPQQTGSPKYVLEEILTYDETNPKAPIKNGKTLRGARWASVGFADLGEIEMSAEMNWGLDVNVALREANKSKEIVNCILATKDFNMGGIDSAMTVAISNVGGAVSLVGSPTPSPALFARGASLVKGSDAYLLEEVVETDGKIALQGHKVSAGSIPSSAITAAVGWSLAIGSWETAAFPVQITQFDERSSSGEGSESTFEGSLSVQLLGEIPAPSLKATQSALSALF